MNKKHIKKILKYICLSEKDKIKKAMKRINYSPYQIVFILNKKKQLIGSVTDGDIRRGLIKKFDIEAPLKKIMKKKYLFLYSHSDQTYALNYMRRKKIEYLPILDKNKIYEYQQNKEPYLMIDFASEVIPGVSSKGYKILKSDEWFFKVHWPGDPNMPGMLQIEALVQMSSLAILTLPGNKGKIMYLTGANNLKFIKNGNYLLN